MISAILTDWSLQSIAALNAVLAWVAAMVHGWAAVKTSGWLRKMFISISGLAFFYSLSYWWLFLNVDKVVEWSNFLRPFGVFTWVAAWAIEPLVLVRYLERRSQEIERSAEAVIERTNRHLDGY